VGHKVKQEEEKKDSSTRFVERAEKVMADSLALASLMDRSNLIVQDAVMHI
jgi:hypothetical protein